MARDKMKDGQKIEYSNEDIENFFNAEATLARIQEALSEIGRFHGGTLSWHRMKDPFGIFVAEYLLRRTTRKVVDRVFPRIMNRYPTAQDLAEADLDELWELASPAGLHSRTLALKNIAAQIAGRGGMDSGGVDREFLLGLPYVGPYIADAVLLYAFDEITFPLDGNAKRVLYRMTLSKEPPKKLEAYDDQVLLGISTQLLDTVNDVRSASELHQGLLYIAWHYCRPRPSCNQCLVRSNCLYGAKLRSENSSSAI